MIWIAIGIAGFAFGLNLTACVAVMLHPLCRPKRPAPDLEVRPVTVITPMKGVHAFMRLTLRTLLRQDHRALAFIMCFESESDPAVEVVREVLAEFDAVDVTLLFGLTHHGPNPKVNNVAKGVEAARTPYLLLCDQNLEVPPAYVSTLMSTLTDDVGLVSAVPLATHATGIGGGLEYAFLNGEAARVWCMIDLLGQGIASGISMLVRRDDLTAIGGVAALDRHVVDDLALSLGIRALGKRVRAVSITPHQRMGRRATGEVLRRYARWGWFRRNTIPIAFYCEPLFWGLLASACVGVIWTNGFERAWVEGFAVGLLSWTTLAWLGPRLRGWPTSFAGQLMQVFVTPAVWLMAVRTQKMVWKNSVLGQPGSSEARPVEPLS